MDAAVFLERYPSFGLAPLATVQAVLDEAGDVLALGRFGRQAGRARMLYAAHQLSLQGVGNEEAGQAAAIRSAGVTSFKSGEVSLSFDQSGGEGGVSDVLSGTSYGKELKALIRAVFAGPLVV